MSQLVLPGVPVPAGDDRRMPDVDTLTEDVIAVLGNLAFELGPLAVSSTDGLEDRIICLRWPRLPPHRPTLMVAIHRLVVAGLVQRDEPQTTDIWARSGCRQVPYWGLTERGVAWVHMAGESGAR